MTFFPRNVIRLVAGCLVLTALALWLSRHLIRPTAQPGTVRTVKDAIKEFSPTAGKRLRQHFDRSGLAFPPPRVLILAFKREKTLEIHVPGNDGKPTLLHTYPILAASGHEGPKLREGDRQVPEGFYRIELLNPNSRYHLSLRVNYPSPHDIQRASEEGREVENLGSDIMIHGKAVSAGCLAIGDPAIEELFLLCAKAGLDSVELLIAPCDLRISPASLPENTPPWTTDLHARIKERLQHLSKKPD
jgi:hypothetical protein